MHLSLLRSVLAGHLAGKNERGVSRSASEAALVVFSTRGPKSMPHALLSQCSR